MHVLKETSPSVLRVQSISMRSH